jgi:molybdopterin-containing oxidoreductase family iron-sulfur binding subunit
MTERDKDRPEATWRSLEALDGDAGALRWRDGEFPDLARATATGRRSLLKLMGASVALAGTAGCERLPAEAPADPIVSRAGATPGHVPGEPLFFATSLPLEGYGRGVLVESHEGRPTKIEGNPLHPASLGATDAFAQAAILSLYAPDRLRAALRRGGGRRRLDGTLAQLAAEFAADGGAGLRLLTGPVSSPSLTAGIASLLDRLPEARWLQWSPVGDGNRLDGAALAFGERLETRLDLARASVIVAIDDDPLGPGPNQVANGAGFIAGRRDPARFSRLWVFEACPSLTGARADRRFPVSPRAVPAIARAVAAALGVVPPADDGVELPPGLVEDLRRAGPAAVVTAGRRAPPEVHALVHAVNLALGAVGTTVHHTRPVLAGAPSGVAALAALAAEIDAGAVSRLVVIDANPAYDAPADLDLARRIRRVPFSLCLASRLDETAAECLWTLPLAHPLESWGDLRAPNGTVGLMQPALAPPAGTMTALELVARLAGSEAPARELVRGYWEQAFPPGEFEAAWLRTLHDGVVEGTAFEEIPVRLAPGWEVPPPVPAQGEGLTVLFAPDPSVWDGQFADNAWLQELPKPLTKLVWDNAILIAPATAARLGLANGDGAVLELHGRALEAPVWLLPGHAPDCVTLPLGYGHRRGDVARGLGFDAYSVRRSEAPWVDGGAVLQPSGRRHLLATTQDHGTMVGRDLVRSVPLARLAAMAALGGEAGGEAAGEEAGEETEVAGEDLPSIYPEYDYSGPAWGMAVDLNACIGCNACVIACQVENNVPAVGKEEVARGREMHWLRIDRYWEGDPADPRIHFQPVLCMHCEKAPCEVVCPVNATVHDSEGLNVMVYNRCIGTRYCSNNCPYKVRRFNWFDYADEGGRPEVTANPDVTLRERGVMEKCTYCVQRIQKARIQAKLEDRPIADGEVVTACQQACPTRAFTFGDITDPASAVSRAKASPLNYGLLEELNTRPRTTYLARIDDPPAPEEAS